MHHRAGVRGPKLSDAGLLTPEWESALRGAYEAGAGRGPLAADDDDMQDAARLATPVGEGGILWHPGSLDDIYSIPARCLLLFDYYMLGTMSARQPWTWWRVKDTRTICHQFNTNWEFAPEPPARCGFRVPEDAELERSDVGKCAKCSKLDKGEEVEATGTVAGVRVGAQRHTGRDPRDG